MCSIVYRIVIIMTLDIVVHVTTETELNNTVTHGFKSTGESSLRHTDFQSKQSVSTRAPQPHMTDNAVSTTTLLQAYPCNMTSESPDCNTTWCKLNGDIKEATTSEVRSDENDSNIIQINVSTTPENNATVTFTGSVSKGAYETFKKVVWFGVIPPIALLGICGNLTGLWFILCGTQRQSFHLLLFALMAVDLIYLIIILLSNSLVILDVYDASLAKLLKCHASASLHAIQSLTYGTCAHLITAMSFERLLNVMFPLKVQSFCFHRKTVVVIFVLFALNIVLGVPGFMIREPKYVRDPLTNVTSCISVPTDWSKNPISKVFVVLYLALARFVPGIITTISSILIAIFLARRRAHRVATFGNKYTKEESYEQFKITLTLMILSISLLLSLIPLATTTLWIKYYPDTYGKHGPEHFKYLLFTDLGYVLRVFSAANDFFIYVILSKSSRNALKSMVRSRCCFCKIQISVLGSVKVSNQQSA